MKKCNFCDKEKFELLFKLEDKNLRLSGEFSLLKCKNCGLISLEQPKNLDKYYPKEYYSFSKIQGKDSLKTRIKLLLYDTYFNPKNKNFFSFRKLALSPLIPFSRGVKILPGKKLLDIGSGSGQFLYEMKQFGINVQGLEPGDLDKREAKKWGLEIKQKKLEDTKFLKNSFDIITINHVLEHVPDPTKTLREIRRILKRGGKLIIGIPNFRSLAYSIFRKDWYQLDVPRHLNNFSDKLLVKKLNSLGFKVERVRYNSRPSQFSVSLLYRLNLDKRKNQKLLRILDIIFLPFVYLVNAIKLGDQIEVYCTK